MAALKVRVQRVAPRANATFVPGNCDTAIIEICAAIPKGFSNNKVLSLCVVDPFDFGIKFETLRRLSAVFVDFVVLLAIGMDANRNYANYVEGHSTKIDEALGNTQWRERWKAEGVRRSELRPFLANEFSISMASLGYPISAYVDNRPGRSGFAAPPRANRVCGQARRSTVHRDGTVRFQPRRSCRRGCPAAGAHGVAAARARRPRARTAHRVRRHCERTAFRGASVRIGRYPGALRPAINSFQIGPVLLPLKPDAHLSPRVTRPG
jgi:hypothetical protein